MRRSPLAPGRRLLIVFVLTIFAPGLLLAFFGARSLWDERRRIDEELKTRLEYSAQIAARSLSEQFSRLQSRLDRQAWRGDHLDWPEDGSWVFVVREDDRTRIYPSNVLPFELQAMDSVAPDVPQTPAERKYREARALNNAGRIDEARRLWQELENSGGLVGSVPADLAAGFALAEVDATAAQVFYDRLTSGRWRIDKARYQSYSNAVLDRVQVNDREQEAFQLADAIEAVLAGSRVVASARGVHVAFRGREPSATLIVSGRLLASIVPPATDAEMRVSAISADGHLVYGRSSSDQSASAPAIERLSAGGINWEVSVEPKDAVAFVSARLGRSNLYLAMLAFVVALLAVGGWLIARTVRREIEIARQKSDFVSTVSHEFRSPLTGIRQLAEMLSRDRVPDERKRHQYYDLILRESERLGRLVESVLDFARMEDGRKRYRFEPFQTVEWLHGLATEFEHEAARAGYALETSIAVDLPCVTGDREALSTAVRNLLDNAVKYSPASKTVWLDAQAVGARVRIRVRDRGIGIPAGQREQVFEKFYRVDGELSKTVKGVGLGLSLVRHIVESHHGTISVESREGVGSTFAIELAAAA